MHERLKRTISMVLVILLVGLSAIDCTSGNQINDVEKDARITELEGRVAQLNEQVAEKDVQIAELRGELAECSGYLRNPSHDELMAFLSEDQTDANDFSSQSYTDSDYARDLKASAQKEGFQAALIIIEFEVKRRVCYCINAFEVGGELVFVEPQTDDIVKVAPGVKYFSDNGYQPPDPAKWDETISRFVVVW